MSEIGSNGSELGNTNSSSGKRVHSSKKWCFTFNNYTKDDIEHLLSCFKGSAKYIFQEETGESGTKHLQGSVEFDNKCRPTEKIKFTSKIHWEKCKDWNASVKYCSKEDTRTGEIYTNIKFPKPIKVIKDLYDWQKDIVKIIEEEPDDRHIYWIWEDIGNTGKSSFAKYLVVMHDAIILSGKGNDCKYGIVKHYENNGVYPDIIIYDIPRTNIDYVSYESLESIKNGLFFSGKYESGQVVMNPPHIICFANSEPDLSKMSADRWKVINLKG